ncbi:MAG: Cof-type HAD-IIB family hydrolase [Erysipelotrichales bacterium]
MKKKLIFFDIDGTIVDHFKKEIPKSTIQALKELKANGHIVAIASGKGPKYIKEMFDDIDINTFAALNGNYVSLNDKVIYKQTINPNLVKKFELFCKDKDIPFTMADEFETKTLFKDKDIVEKYYKEFSATYPPVIDDIKDYNAYYQMSVMIKQEDEDKLIPYFKELSFVRMSQYGMNVNPVGGLKEKGIKYILDHSDYTSDDLVVFGDGLNDMGMFALAKTSVAMGNANEKLKEVATYTTSHISENGIYNACKHLNLI